MVEGTSEGREEAFSEGSPDRDYAKDYLAEVRTNWREVESSVSRAAGLRALGGRSRHDRVKFGCGTRYWRS
jgi:hypothetical protein